MKFVDLKKSDLFEICKLNNLDVNDQMIKDILHSIEKEGNCKFKQTFRASLIQDIKTKMLKLIYTWHRLNEKDKISFLNGIENRFCRFNIEPSDVFKESLFDYINKEFQFNKDRLKLSFEECLILNREINILKSRIESLNDQMEQKEIELRLNSTKLELLQKKFDSMNNELESTFSDKLNGILSSNFSKEPSEQKVILSQNNENVSIQQSVRPESSITKILMAPAPKKPFRIRSKTPKNCQKLMFLLQPQQIDQTHVLKDSGEICPNHEKIEKESSCQILKNAKKQVYKRRNNSVANILEQIDNKKDKKIRLSQYDGPDEIEINFKSPVEIKQTLDSLESKPPITQDSNMSRKELREELEQYKHLINVRKIGSHTKDDQERETIKLKWSKSRKENHN